MNKKRNIALDITRGISALIIMLYHYTVRYNDTMFAQGLQTAWHFSIPLGYMAVYTFFILSGFLTDINKEIKGGAVEFLLKRFLRLYPVFLICMLKYVHLFVLGIMFKRITQHLVNYKTILITLLCLINQYLNLGYIATLWIIATCLFIFMLMRMAENKTFSENIVVKLICNIAAVSYPLYLLHQVIGYIIINRLQFRGMTSVYLIIIPIAVSIALAEIIHFTIEKCVLKNRNHIINYIYSHMPKRISK